MDLYVIFLNWLTKHYGELLGLLGIGGSGGWLFKYIEKAQKARNDRFSNMEIRIKKLEDKVEEKTTALEKAVVDINHKIDISVMSNDHLKEDISEIKAHIIKLTDKLLQG